MPAAGAVASGQLVIRDFTEIYGSAAEPDLAGIGAGFRAAASQARDDGFPALRVAAEMGDFATALGSIEAVLRWERMASRLQHEERISSVCQYDLRRFGDLDTAAIAAEHSGIAPDAAQPPQASFLATGTPWGLRVSGELDMANRAQLTRVLRARLLASPVLRLDVGGVSFADVGVVVALYEVAAGLPDDGRIILVQTPPPLRQLIQLTGLRHPWTVLED